MARRYKKILQGIHAKVETAGAAPGAPWYNAAWDYRVKVTVDATQVSEDLTDYPLLISNINMPDDFFTNVASGGVDIVVTASDGQTKLKRDLGYVGKGDKIMDLWVKIPSLVTSADTIVYVYYGNAAAAETNDTDTWDSNYTFVWHAHETDWSGGDPDTVRDRTANGNDFDAYGGQTPSDFGNHHPGRGYDWISARGVPGGDRARRAPMITAFPITMTMYGIQADHSDAAVGSCVMSAGVDSGTTTDYIFFRVYNQQHANSRKVQAQIRLASGSSNFNSSFQYNQGDPTAIQYALTNSTTRTLHVNGISQTETASNTTAFPSSTNWDGINIVERAGTSNHVYGCGVHSEVRYSKTTRSGGWAATEFNNIRDTANFMSIDAQEAA
jgi:hypothetical protein